MKPATSNPEARLYVGNLCYSTNIEALKTFFEEAAGPVQDIYMPFAFVNKRFKNKGFAFVEMKKQKDALKAIELLDGTEGPGDRTLSVRLADYRK
jgi:RNA recognition motif-containing protein